MSALLSRTRHVVVVAVVGILVASALLVFRDGDTRIVAYFSSSTGLYEGDEVRVLGVNVGTVESVKPQGDRVKIELSVDDSQPIPPNAKAAIVSPSLVNGYFVQLAPVWRSGPQMEDGTKIPLGRTAVPVSFDEVKKELTDLSTALGPNGSGAKEGALNEAITTIDANLGGGTAAELRSSMSAMRSAAEELSDGRSDLFVTIKQLNTFTKNLVANDSALRGATTELTEFSSVLDDNKGQLAKTIESLDQALRLITSFVRDNTDELSTSVRTIGELSKTTADKSDSIAQLLHTGPNAVEGLYNSVENSAVTGRVALGNTQGTAQLVCGLVLGAGGTAQDCNTAIAPLLELLGVTELPGAPGVGSGAGVEGPDSPAAGAEDLANGLTELLGGLG